MSAQDRERYIEELRDQIDEGQEENAHLRAVNAKLLAALKEIGRGHVDPKGIARAAIAHAKGEQPA